LIDTFGSPFDERPVVPEFKVPAAYNVTNVPALSTQMNSFTDETLIMIFYENPRDLKQEQAAQTLFKRNWRWHTTLQQWMMKDNSMGEPQRISEKQERGIYIFFDVNNWRRERREFLLNYDDMYPRIPSGSSL
jgi:CCR4-NOT transcription complex subunit 2